MSLNQIAGLVHYGSRSFHQIMHISVSNPKQDHERLSVRSKRTFVVKAASSSTESSGSSSNIAPLKLESPIGQFLSQILVSHPHLMSAAVEQQLEQFQTDRDGHKKWKSLLLQALT